MADTDGRGKTTQDNTFVQNKFGIASRWNNVCPLYCLSNQPLELSQHFLCRIRRANDDCLRLLQPQSAIAHINPEGSYLLVFNLVYRVGLGPMKVESKGIKIRWLVAFFKPMLYVDGHAPYFRIPKWLRRLLQPLGL